MEPRPAASKHPEAVEVAVRYKEERSYGPGELNPGIIIRDQNNNNVNLIWGQNPDGEDIIVNMNVIQPGYTFIDETDTQFNILRTDINTHTITVSIPGSIRSVSPPAQAAAASKGGMKKRRAHKRHTKKRHTKKRHTHKYRARK